MRLVGVAEPHPALYVPDSRPLVEWLKGKQPIEARVVTFLADAARGEYQLAISRINLGEMVYLGRKDVGLSASAEARLLGTLRDIPLEILSATDARVDAAVDLKARYNISYADAFAAALSMERNAPLVTGDREFRALELDGLIQLHWIGN